LFGRFKWDRKNIKTSLQNFIRSERANLKRDHDKDYLNEEDMNNNGLIVAEEIHEHFE
jgi:hypothetical protein